MAREKDPALELGHQGARYACPAAAEHHTNGGFLSRSYWIDGKGALTRSEQHRIEFVKVEAADQAASRS